jgi:hypothetical protein
VSLKHNQTSFGGKPDHASGPAFATSAIAALDKFTKRQCLIFLFGFNQMSHQVTSVGFIGARVSVMNEVPQMTQFRPMVILICILGLSISPVFPDICQDKTQCYPVRRNGKETKRASFEAPFVWHPPPKWLRRTVKEETAPEERAVQHSSFVIPLVAFAQRKKRETRLLEPLHFARYLKGIEAQETKYWLILVSRQRLPR